MKQKQLCRGFSLIEVLISFVILVIGILGAATLIMRSSQVNMMAYETEQAAIVANNIIETIRSDPDNAKKYVNNSDRSGYDSLPDSCKNDSDEASCTPLELVKLNWKLFNDQLKETNLPNASLDVQEIILNPANGGLNNNKEFIVIISWGPTDDENKKLKTYIVNFVVTSPIDTDISNKG